jgi:hypothetical protein
VIVEWESIERLTIGFLDLLAIADWGILESLRIGEMTESAINRQSNRQSPNKAPIPIHQSRNQSSIPSLAITNC